MVFYAGKVHSGIFSWHLLDKCHTAREATLLIFSFGPSWTRPCCSMCELIVRSQKPRRHSWNSNPRRIAVVSQMCIRMGVIVISVKMHLLSCDLDLSPLNPKTMSFLGYPKVIPWIKFEYFWIIQKNWVMLQSLMWKTHLLTTWPRPLTSQLQNYVIRLLGYPKVIPIPSLNTLRSFRFWVKPVHYPSWRPELTGDRFPLPVNSGR